MQGARVLFLVALLLVGSQALAEERESRLVKTTQGPVKGYKEGDVFSFYGIPYATAPIGTSKFKAPLPAPVWLQPLEAVDEGIICHQAAMPEFSKMYNDKKQQEDCLIANVFVPDTEEQGLPVIVYVHGGAYQMGFGNMFKPKNLVKSKKVIAVTFNYRVGVFGFLCLGTTDAPGNAGMKDQVALLRWVQKNIAKFGGNPKDVTVAGYSAGASAVDLLMLSKTTKGLFNKVIPESGANVGVWSVQIDPIDNARDYALNKLNFTEVDDIYALEELYKNAPIESLKLDLFLDRTDSTFAFVPCIERVTGEERFLTDSPVNIMKEGKYEKVPVLYGFANMEGLFRVQFGMKHWIRKMNEKFSDFLPADLQFESEEQKEELANKVKEFYFGDKAISLETILGYIDFFTDVIFAYPTLRSTRLHVEAGNNNVYLYEYSFVPKEMPSFPGIEVEGANHCAQTAAVMDGVMLPTADGFIMSDDESKSSEEYQKMKSVMRELWLNFITTGTPVPSGSSLPAWPPADKDRSPHMSLDRTLQLRGALLPQRARFWDDIYEKHYRAPAPPPNPPPRPHSEL